MTSKGSAAGKKRILIDSVRKSLRGFLYFFVALLWIGLILFLFRVHSFRNESPFWGLLAMTAFLSLFSGAAHFLREALLNWTEYPFWPDEFHFARDHSLISVPVWGISLAVLSQFSWSGAFFPVLLLWTIDLWGIFYLLVPTERLIRFIRSYADGPLFADDDRTLSPPKSTPPEAVPNKATLSESIPNELTPSESIPFESTGGKTSASPRGVPETLPFKTTDFLNGESEPKNPSLPPRQAVLFDDSDESDETKTIKIVPLTGVIEDFFDASGEETEDEDSDEVPPPPDMFLSQNRFAAADGTERIEGWVRVPFRPEEETAIVHLAFCPPLKSSPHLQLIQIAGPDVLMKPTQVETFGARIEVKRTLDPHLDDAMERMTVSAGFPDESVRICFFADENK